MTLPRVVAIPWYATLLWLNRLRLWRISLRAWRIERQLARSERAKFGRVLTERERVVYYR